jgi:DNA-binding MurR/RpiR family transcriptional regulator
MAMIANGIFDHLRTVVGGRLTSAEEKVVAWILNNPTKPLDFSIGELAAASGVSEATVVRTCQRLGFKGYPELKLAIAADLFQRPQKDRPTTLLGGVEAEDSLATIVSKIFETNIEVLSRSLEHLDLELVERALTAILGAQRVIVLSAGTQAHLADLVCAKLSSAGIHCVGRVDHLQQIAAAAVAEPTDVMLVFSHSGRVRMLIEAAQTAKAAGATTVGVTNFGRSMLAKVVDIPIVTHGRDLAFYSEAMGSHLVQMVLVDCLLVGIVSRRRDALLPKMIKARQAVEQHRL